MARERIDHMADLAEQLKTIMATNDRPWVKTWDVANDGGALRSNGEAFTGGNNPWLMLNAMAAGYASSYWFTSKQAREAGCPLDWDAAKGKHVTVLRPKMVRDEKAGDPKATKCIGFMGYRVYSGDFAQGWADPAKESRTIPQPDAASAAILDLWGGVQHGGGRAFYRPSTDSVTMPPRDAFHSLADYVGTGCHEKAHQSGHRKRLNRDGIVNPVIFGDHTYAEEELVAESCAAFLLGRLGMQTEAHTTNNAAYLRHWNRKLQSDPQALIRAMGQGMRAAGYILKAAGLPA